MKTLKQTGKYLINKIENSENEIEKKNNNRKITCIYNTFFILYYVLLEMAPPIIQSKLKKIMKLSNKLWKH